MAYLQGTKPGRREFLNILSAVVAGVTILPTVLKADDHAPICTRFGPSERDKAYFVSKYFPDGGPAYLATKHDGKVVFEPVDFVPRFNGLPELSLKEMLVAEKIMNSDKPDIRKWKDGNEIYLTLYSKKFEAPNGIRYSLSFANLDERVRNRGMYSNTLQGDSLDVGVIGINPNVFKLPAIINQVIDVLGEDAYNYLKQCYEENRNAGRPHILDSGMDSMIDEAHNIFDRQIKDKPANEQPIVKRFDRMLDHIIVHL
ncbi:MAG: hypothetical protein U9O94_09335 [Nanoarchaeota archaeon]|nr:hypothetical protein [Nanoarchaeota archaeon]